MEVTDPDQTTDNNGKDANFSQFASTYEIFSDHPKSNHRSLLLQKRQRVSRACDECRRRKIKCDGRQPCAHCTIYAYNCAYDQPSKRHRKPDPQYVEALEGRLHKAEAILRTVLPSSFDNESPAEKDPMHRLIHLKHTQTLTHETLADSLESSRENVLNAGKESLLETFPGDTGHLDLDDHKKWDYHGPTSGIFFVQRLRKQLGVVETPENRTMMQGSLRSTPAALFPHDGSLPPTYLLPSQTVVIRLCHNALGHASSFMCLVIEHHFFSSLGRIYDLPYEQLNNEDKSFLPLLYIATALGALFEVESPGTLNLTDYEDAIDHSLRFFKLGRRLLEITDCRDLTSLQAICFVVLFLQSSAKLSACYSYIGIALHAGLRLGIHRAVTTEFDPIEQELRKRIFWFIRTMDIFVSTMLGLPQLMSSDDIDQEYPICVDGRFITAGGIAQMPPDYTPLMAGCNALSRLGKVLLKLVKRIYPVSNADFRSKSNLHKIIDHSSIQEIERELETWIEELPPALRSTTEASPQFERSRLTLRIYHAYVQMVMYRPFLHNAFDCSPLRNVDNRSHACALACVSASRHIVHLSTDIHNKLLLDGSLCLTIYIIYFAIITLISFVVENFESPTLRDCVLRDAMEGQVTLSKLAKKSMAADKCSQSLALLFKPLLAMLKNYQYNNTLFNLKRSAPSSFTIEQESVQNRPP